MKGLSREFLVIWGGLIFFFLAVEHYTGFSKDIGAIGSGVSGVSRVLQGR